MPIAVLEKKSVRFHNPRLLVTDENLETLKTLPFIHRDPFDRLLIAQAQDAGLSIITRGSIIPKYDVKTVW